MQRSLLVLAIIGVFVAAIVAGQVYSAQVVASALEDLRREVSYGGCGSDERHPCYVSIEPNP